MARTVDELRKFQQRTEAMERRPAATTRTRTDDRQGGGGTSVIWAVLRYATAAECWAQEVRYSGEIPIEGAIEAVGGWFKVHPVPGGLYESFEAFVVPQFTQANAPITNGTEYDAATAEDSSDPLNPMALTTGNLIPAKVYQAGSIRIAEIALKMPRRVAIVNPFHILPGGSSV